MCRNINPKLKLKTIRSNFPEEQLENKINVYVNRDVNKDTKNLDNNLHLKPDTPKNLMISEREISNREELKIMETLKSLFLFQDLNNDEL